MATTLQETIKNLEEKMNAAYAAADELREAEDHDAADVQLQLAEQYKSRLNRRKKFLKR